MLDVMYFKKQYIKTAKLRSMFDYLFDPWLRFKDKGGNNRWRQIRKLHKGGI